MPPLVERAIDDTPRRRCGPAGDALAGSATTRDGAREAPRSAIADRSGQAGGAMPHAWPLRESLRSTPATRRVLVRASPRATAPSTRLIPAQTVGVEPAAFAGPRARGGRCGLESNCAGGDDG